MFVGRHQVHRRREFAVVLDHHDARAHAADRLQHVVVVAVDIDAEEVQLAGGGDVRAGQQRVDVLRRDAGFKQLEPAVGQLRGEDAPDALAIAGVRFHPQAAPSFHQQLERVALAPVRDAEFDKCAKRAGSARAGADAAEDFLEDPVLVVLRPDLAAVALQAAASAAARVGQQLAQLARAAQVQFQVRSLVQAGEPALEVVDLARQFLQLRRRCGGGTAEKPAKDAHR